MRGFRHPFPDGSTDGVGAVWHPFVISSCRMTYPSEIAHIRLDAFLVALADGWNFIDDLAEPEAGHHARFSCLMFRALEATGEGE